MAINANTGGGGNFMPAPAGTHVAVCVDVVDLGMVSSTFAGKTSMKHKVRMVWQIAEDRDDGKPFLVFRTYALTLHEKSSLRKDLQSWRGRPFTAEEVQKFDVEPMTGKACLLNVIHNTVGENTYANVAGIMPLPKGMVAPEPRDYVRVVDRPAEPDAPAEAQPAAPRVRRVMSDEDLPDSL